LFRGLADAGTTVVIATHDCDIMRIADRTLSLVDGMIGEVRDAHAPAPARVAAGLAASLAT
jgi:ABC-type ATPase involved in cell division